MNNAIRHTWVVSVALFVTLFAALSIIQVAMTDELNANPNNVRQLYEDRGAPRGTITVDGRSIAESVRSESSAFDYQRVYSEPELYSGITGFYSIAEPPTGLESAMNEYLSGHSDSQFLDRMTAMFTGQSMDGAQVELTLDGELQQMAYDMIPDDQRGSIVVTDVRTGEVKAMASKPSYDTNLLAVQSTEQFNENKAQVEDIEGLSPYFNRPTNSAIAPGSTFKLVDLVAMLESGDYEPDTVLDNPNSVTLPQSSSQLQNFSRGICEQRSEAELSWLVAQSCNTPFAEAAMDLGEGTMQETAEAFGWNSELDIPVTTGASRFPDELTDASLAHSAIGQFDVTATPLQMNMVASAIANGGTLMKPNLVESVSGSDLQLLEQFEPEELNDVMSSEVSEDITEMMTGVVEDGTGVRAQSDQFDIAAKTGTAEIGETDMVNSWVTGFAPADDPQYAVTVAYERIDYETGSSLTTPQLKEILEAVVEE